MPNKPIVSMTGTGMDKAGRRLTSRKEKELT
jgi:hypothetical protein